MSSQPKYPLEQVALIKQKKLEEAEKALKEKKELLKTAEEKLKTVEKERDTVKDHRIAKLTQLREKLDEGTSTDKIQQMKHYLKTVEDQLKIKEKKVQEQQAQVKQAETHVETARKVYIQRQHDIEKLAIHRKEWQAEVKAEEVKQEAIEGDELGSAMHARRKKPKH